MNRVFAPVYAHNISNRIFPLVLPTKVSAGGKNVST